MKNPATRMPLQEQAFQAMVRLMYSQQNAYENDKSDLLTATIQKRRCQEVDRFFKSYVDPSTWWLKKQINMYYTPTPRARDQEITEFLYGHRDMWKDFDTPDFTYSDLPRFTDEMSASPVFRHKWKCALSPLDSGQVYGDSTPAVGANPWMPSDGGAPAPASLTAPAAMSLPNVDEQCTRAAATLGYYIITRAMRGWKDGSPPEVTDDNGDAADSTDGDDCTLHLSPSNIFFAVSVCAPDGPITCTEVQAQLLRQIQEAEKAVQEKFDWIFRGYRFNKHPSLLTEEDRAALMKVCCPMKFTDKSNRKMDQMLGLCMKTSSILEDCAQRVFMSKQRNDKGAYVPTQVIAVSTPADQPVASDGDVAASPTATTAVVPSVPGDVSQAACALPAI